VNFEDAEEVLFVVEAGKVKKIPVKTGIQDNDYIEIRSGIKAGAVVVSAPYNTISKLLKEGMEVEVVSKEKIYSKK
jgi:HlyD family secretion protein